MKVTFRVNLGRNDAKKFGLEHEDCKAGATVEVTTEQANALKKKYPAIFVDAAELKGVATKPAITAPAKTEK